MNGETYAFDGSVGLDDIERYIFPDQIDGEDKGRRSRGRERKKEREREQALEADTVYPVIGVLLAALVHVRVSEEAEEEGLVVDFADGAALERDRVRQLVHRVLELLQEARLEREEPLLALAHHTALMKGR